MPAALSNTVSRESNPTAIQPSSLSKILTAARLTTALFVTSLSACVSLGAPNCKLTVRPNFWQATEPVILGTNSKGQSLYTTFSCDSEISAGDMWDRISRATPPDKLARAKSLFDEIVPRIKKQDLINTLHYSEKQLSAFALRPGVDPQQVSFAASDLRPSALHVDENKIYDQMRAWDTLVENYLVPALGREGLPVAAHMDSTSPELTHPSAEASPSIYAKMIKRLHTLLPRAATHFHIGIPSELVSVRDVTEIGRAVEAKVVLGLLLTSEPTEQATPYSGSTFIDLDGVFGFNGQRGNIKLALYDQDRKTGFTEPFAAHDLEIRQWINVADGLSSLSIAARLAAKAATKTLPHHHVDHSLFLSEPRYGSVAASLDYIGSVLMADHHDLGLQLKAYAQRAVSNEAHDTEGLLGKKMAWDKSSWVLKREFLDELQTFCRRNEVMSRYENSLN